ncbi:nuclear transport factor 2 family protein [Lutimonas halocynthiae]|uniref:YybH family protein n=1 Tax=Lutimonas halocynthiae TaxID=1446477 RepID=UPI0025B2D3F8|nr:nuclear transport factor 2 family protein [Lutimonas halocynthiae]MDN3642757.1 nuclear transport factor 2 family protein [Lutimonas halocynthiae]
MKNLILLISIVCLNSVSTLAQNADKEAIKNLLEVQRQAWNNYDIDGFMEGYWKSEDLKFYGSNGVTYGWDNTLARYKKAYPTKEHFGTLEFVLNEISIIDEGSYYVMGEYHLKRTMGNADGIFMLILKKIKGEWKIIADTSS